MLAIPELEIARHLPPDGCTPAEAQRYTRWLATHHYENFMVVSWLLPRRLHQHFYNLYAYCRWSDDLGDEISNPRRAMELLDAWEEELLLCYSATGGPSHPVLLALRETIRAKDVPATPFRDLLKAFRQDQVVHRYPTWDDVLNYCVYSANPVGRLVLYLCGYRDEERQKLSDDTCTALQLANFWQDVSRDLEKGRIYIPLDALTAHDLTESQIVGRKFDARYVALMKDLISRTRELFSAGVPLAGRVEPFLRVDIEMFTHGGLAVLDAIETSGYNTLEHRPAISKRTQLRLLGRTLAARALSSLSGGDTVQAEEVAGVKKAHVPFRTEDPADQPQASSEAIQNSHAECHRIARASKSSFYLSFFGLRREKRNALYALYAFNR
ncbi:MAG TPA: squalene synthase HpnC, partial [Candidatus Limnocylindrales bacterium]|nr:squalene synthase HpnC [Candidatus Limnocylindrales bacterium]